MEDVNEPPMKVIGSSWTVSVPENIAINSTIFTIPVVDPDYGQTLTFRIVGVSGGNSLHQITIGNENSPALQLKQALDFETMENMENHGILINVVVCDSLSLCITGEVTVTVLDMNEAPAFVRSNDTITSKDWFPGYVFLDFRVSKYAQKGDTIGKLCAIDPDISDFPTFLVSSSEQNYSTFSSSSNFTLIPCDGAFGVNAASGEVFVSSVSLQSHLYEVDGENVKCIMFATVIDRYSLSDTAVMILELIPGNTAPICENTSARNSEFLFHTNESAPLGTLIGTPLIQYVHDADSGTHFTFDLQHPFLGVAPATGQLYISAYPNFDYETLNGFPNTSSIAVTVRDDGISHDGRNSLQTTCNVEIISLDVNEPPTTIPSMSFSLKESPSTRSQSGLASEAFTFYVKNSRDDFDIINTGGTDSTILFDGRTLGMGYDAFTRHQAQTVLIFQDLDFQERDDFFFLENVQLNFHVPSGQIGPFSLKISTLNADRLHQVLETGTRTDKLGANTTETFVEWTLSSKQYTRIIQTPNLARLFDSDQRNPITSWMSMESAVFKIEGSGVGEVDSFDSRLTGTPSVTFQFSLAKHYNISNAIVTFNDVDAGDEHCSRFSLVSGNPDPNKMVFQVDPKTGQITTAIQLLDYESQNLYELKVKVEDKDGLQAVCVVFITILDINEPPAIEEILCLISEDSVSVGDYICVAKATDPDSIKTNSGGITFQTEQGMQATTAFAIDKISGVITVANASAFDYEKFQKITDSICVVDGGYPPLIDCNKVNIIIGDANDAPSFISPTLCYVNELDYTLTHLSPRSAG
ncbi:hypothetical protein ABG067_001246 [Albugo candida]